MTLTERTWQRSSFCSGGGNNCVEVAANGDGVALRESEDPARIIATDGGSLRALVATLKEGAFRVSQN
jgi:hypothetical protein